MSSGLIALFLSQGRQIKFQWLGLPAAAAGLLGTHLSGPWAVSIVKMTGVAPSPFVFVQIFLIEATLKHWS